ncbi:MAG: lysine exporter protein LysE/YggA [Candidatus Parcubacteria bacterium]|nr:lysine exporter protein LysE/YggA [Candidatus Parcubacteria bacterium]
MFFTQFLTVAIVHLLAVMSPGPDFAMVTRNSLIHSRKSGIYTSLGLAGGIGVHVTYCLFGIGILISQSIIIFSVIKFIGAGYLIYIGYKSIRAKPKEEIGLIQNAPSASAAISPLKSVRIGFLTNVLNPKATLFMLALFTQVISTTTPKSWEIMYGVEMMLATFAWFSIVSVFFSNKAIKSWVSRFQHYIERATGVVLIALGIKVALVSQK